MGCGGSRSPMPMAMSLPFFSFAKTRMLETRILDSRDQAVLANVAPGVFDNAIDPRLVDEFLSDPRHHLAVAIDGGRVVGFASGVHYIHPDKPAELWINEVGVSPDHQGRGVGKA